MKKLFIISLAVVMVCALAACSQPSSEPEKAQTPEPEKTVVFSDPLLEKMVRTAINKPEGDITLAEAEAVTELKLGIDWQQEPAPNTQIKDISGLENFNNLEILELHFHAITNISPLAGLTKLTNLSLGGNPVTDISPLAGLTSLGSLTLFNCQAQDYSPLTNLTGLGMLLLEHSTISDVSMLSGLTELWWLGLANTQVRDVSPLAGLTNLRQLQLSGCPISDYTSLAAIYPNLEEKDFSIVSSLRELGFAIPDNAPQIEAYKAENMYVSINRAEWGEPENRDNINALLLCKNPGTEHEIMVVYNPDQKTFFVFSEQGDFRYTFDPKSDEMNVEYGEWDALGAFIEKAYAEVDPYLQLTPIKDFNRVMSDTFGVSADTLYALPRESEAPPEQPAASENSLIGLGFGFDPEGICGVYEQHEPYYMNVAIHRPEWGEYNEDWNIEYLDTAVNGYGLRITYNATEGKYHITADKDNMGAAFDYYPAAKKYTDEYPDMDTVKRMFNDAFGTQGDDFYDKPLANFEQLVQERFGMSIDELYALPKQ